MEQHARTPSADFALEIAKKPGPYEYPVPKETVRTAFLRLGQITGTGKKVPIKIPPSKEPVTAPKQQTATLQAARSSIAMPCQVNCHFWYF